MTIFTDQNAAVAAVQANYLYGLQASLAPGFNPSTAYIWSQLLAAEKDASRRLRCFLEPTEIFPENPTADDIAALPPGTPTAMDPAYDYDPNNFIGGSSWGFMVLRQKPIIAIDWIQFAYPEPTSNIFQVPDDWIRMDPKYGHVRFVPSGAYSLPTVSAFVLSAVGGGVAIPHMIRVRYSAGLQNVQTDWPDLYDLVIKMAVLRIISGLFLPQSGSISADGLSQSTSIDLSKFGADIDAQISTLRDAIQGVRLTVF